MQYTIQLIRELDAEIEEIEAAIQAIMDELHSPITTISGIGYRMGAMILTKVGDFSHFDFPDKLLAYAGMSPSAYQSGKLKNCYPYIEKRICAMPSTTLPSMSVIGIRLYRIRGPPGALLCYTLFEPSNFSSPSFILEVDI